MTPEGRKVTPGAKRLREEEEDMLPELVRPAEEVQAAALAPQMRAPAPAAGIWQGSRLRGAAPYIPRAHCGERRSRAALRA